MLILTNSSPQSIDVMLCLYKEWHKLQIQIKGIYVPRIQLVSLPSGIHQICIPAFPFDPPTQSDTYTQLTSRFLQNYFSGVYYYSHSLYALD